MKLDRKLGHYATGGRKGVSVLPIFRVREGDQWNYFYHRSMDLADRENSGLALRQG